VFQDAVGQISSSTLKLVLGHFLDGPGARPGRSIFPIPREEEGSILSGLALAGRRAIMIFQDNGISNMLTALLMIYRVFEEDPVVLARAFTDWLQAWTGFRPRS